jgi:uncharacterized protein
MKGVSYRVTPPPGERSVTHAARAALDWLSARSAGLPLLVIGHSEGTYYAAQLAGEGGVVGAVLLSGSVRTGDEVLAW